MEGTGPLFSEQVNVGNNDYRGFALAKHFIQLRSPDQRQIYFSPICLA